jgi:hypothetical protein
MMKVENVIRIPGSRRSVAMMNVATSISIPCLIDGHPTRD